MLKPGKDVLAAVYSSYVAAGAVRAQQRVAVQRAELAGCDCNPAVHCHSQRAVPSAQLCSWSLRVLVVQGAVLVACSSVLAMVLLSGSCIQSFGVHVLCVYAAGAPTSWYCTTINCTTHKSVTFNATQPPRPRVFCVKTAFIWSVCTCR